ncbi:MAG TPA: hypothetical protein DEB16_07590 [Ruminococcaceae bacterium]|nr:hypothetical protein [Oscillospiraceae bacterium]HBQ45725.1 hypothetical protein [Oscillospiraceae bacterium]HBT91692.1 hypothetical protein [Oscillospiraceae bacterium]
MSKKKGSDSIFSMISRLRRKQYSSASQAESPTARCSRSRICSSSSSRSSQIPIFSFIDRPPKNRLEILYLSRGKDSIAGKAPRRASPCPPAESAGAK